MADLTTQTLGETTFGGNYLKHNIETGLNGRTLILKLAGSNITDANLKAVIQYITMSHGDQGEGDSAFVVAGIGTADGSAFESGVTDNVWLAIQGTGDITVATADMSIPSLTITVQAVFNQKYGG